MNICVRLINAVADSFAGKVAILYCDNDVVHIHISRTMGVAYARLDIRVHIQYT